MGSVENGELWEPWERAGVGQQQVCAPCASDLGEKGEMNSREGGRKEGRREGRKKYSRNRNRNIKMGQHRFITSY